MYDKATEKFPKSFWGEEGTPNIIYLKQCNSEHVYLPRDMRDVHIN